MIRHIPTLAILLGTSLLSSAQCSIDLPADSVTIYWGYEPLSCTTLTPSATGTAPLELTWSTGSNANSIVVCDTASSWYFVSLEDADGCTSLDSVYVRVVDVHCGNNGNKVKVCHIPPGNPTNAHDICISANGVPAHLAHGCRLGACESEDDDDGEVENDVIMVTVSPNPMEETTSITVQSAVQQQVRLTVVDIMGRRMHLLLDVNMAAGDQRVVRLDASTFPTGTAMVWIEAQGTSGRAAQRLLMAR